MYAICLALDKRKDEWKKLQEQCKNSGIEMIPFIAGDGSDDELVYDHIDIIPQQHQIANWGYSRPGFEHHHINAFLCHQKMIKKAQDMNLPYFLLLEDDTYLTNRFDEIIQEIQYFIDYCQWDIIYLGWWVGQEDDEWNLQIEEEYKNNKKVKLLKYEKNIGGLHGAIINSNIYNLLLKLKPNNPIDSQLNMLIEFNAVSPLINRFIVTPKALHVKSIYSFCEGSVLQRKVI